MAQTPKIIGVDLGYGISKFYSQGEKVKFESVVARPTVASNDLNEMDFGTKRNLLDALEIDMIKVPNFAEGKIGRRSIGKRAIYDSNSPFFSLDKDRFKYDDTLPLFEAGIALLLNMLDDCEGEVKIVTGLPNIYFTDDNKQQIKNMWLGEHKIKLIGDYARPQITDLKEANFEVVDVSVILQPLGAWSFRIYDQNGDITEEGAKLAQEITCIIDVGTYSTDILVMRDLKPVSHLTFSVQAGMSKVYEGISAFVCDQLPSRPIIPVQKFLASTPEQMESFYVEGNEFNLKSEYDKQLKIVSQEIITHIKQKFSREHQIAKFWVVGGGGIAMLDHFKYFLGGENGDAVQLLSKDPQFCNVIGFYRHGMRKELVKSKK